MGLETQEYGKRTYLGITQGKVTSKDGNGNKQYNTAITGHLTDITFRDGEAAKFGPEIHLHIRDAGTEYILQMRFASGYAIGFMKAIENADLLKPITFAPWYKEKDDNKQGGMNLIQGGKQLPWKYTREEPNGMPEWEDIPDGQGGTKKSKWPVLVFLRKMLEEKMIPLVREAAEFVAAEAAVPAPVTPQEAAVRLYAPAAPTVADMPPIGGDDDDLPF